MFPSDYMFDTVVTCSVLSYNEAGDAEVLAGLGASAAIAISDIPFTAPIGNAKVARIDGKFVLNPNYADWATSDMEIAVAASKDAILMVEGEAHELPEKEVLAEMDFPTKTLGLQALKIYKLHILDTVKKILREEELF